MRVRARHLSSTLAGLLVACALLSLGCDSANSLTGPSNAPPTGAAARIDGAWTGSFVSNDPNGCGSSSATAVLRQNGATVTGNVSTSSCGVTGLFKGTVQGNQVSGAVEMLGCLGGSASGTLEGDQLVLSISDLTKPLLTGDETVMYGGVVTFRR
jgi:hypothetical protein